MRVGIGIITYQRPDRYALCARSVVKHLLPLTGSIVAYNDGSPDGYDEVEGIVSDYILGTENRGVAGAKNACLRALLQQTILLGKGRYGNLEWLFLCEDDMVIDSPDAVTGYIAAAEASGQRHLNFHAHGPANRVPMFTDGPITLWPNIVGSWSLYHRDDLEAVGLMDEGMVNAFEHVEHTARLMKHGACHRWPGVADATGSEYWLHEQEGAIEDTSIPTAGRFDAQRAAIARWKERDEETLRMIFPKETIWEREAVSA